MTRRGDELGDYRGLVFATARRYVGFVDLEFEDLAQELWVKVLVARRAFNPQRSRMTERQFVFMSVTNKMKDLKRDTANRRRRGRGSEADIADVGHEDEVRHLAQSHDETFRNVDDGTFRLPSTLTEFEVEVVVLLTLDFNQTEAAAHLGVPRTRVRAALASVQEKMADWRPEGEPSPPIELTVGRHTSPSQAAA